MIHPDSVADTGAFLARLVRLDPAALVRLRPVDGRPDLVTLWARLPFDVLVSRTVRGEFADDATVRAGQLLAALPDGPLPARRDADWRGALPPPAGAVRDEVPAAEVRRIADAAAATLRQSAGRGVGERRLRDALLDHVALTLHTPGEPDIAVPTRVVTALVRMGFVGPDPVRFSTVGPWLAAHGRFGTAWYRSAAGLTLDPLNGG